MSVASLLFSVLSTVRRAAMVTAVRLIFGFVALLGASSAACQPSALAVTPSEGAFRGGDQLRISGQGFAGRGPLVVYVCQRSAKAIVIENDRLIRIRTPRADVAGSCELTLHFAGDEDIVVKDAFTYREPVTDLPIDAFDRLSSPVASP